MHYNYLSLSGVDTLTSYGIVIGYGDGTILSLDKNIGKTWLFPVVVRSFRRLPISSLTKYRFLDQKNQRICRMELEACYEGSTYEHLKILHQIVAFCRKELIFTAPQPQIFQIALKTLLFLNQKPPENLTKQLTSLLSETLHFELGVKYSTTSTTAHTKFWQIVNQTSETSISKVF